jgi:hypothetical protein
MGKLFSKKLISKSTLCPTKGLLPINFLIFGMISSKGGLEKSSSCLIPVNIKTLSETVLRGITLLQKHF